MKDEKGQRGYSYKSKNPKEITSRSLTSNSFLSGRYDRKSISNSKLKQINEQIQSIVYPNSGVSKDKNKDIVMGIDFRHSFSHNFDYNKRSPTENKLESVHESRVMPLNDSFEYKNVYSIDTCQSKNSIRKTSVDDRSAHKRVTSDIVNNYHSKISVVDSNMLRERGKDLKLKNKRRFHISGKSQRSDSQSEIIRYTPVSKRSELSASATKDQKLVSVEENIKRQLKEIEERTTRASTRGKDVKCFDEKRMAVFTKALRDLADSGCISNSLVTLLKEGFEDCVRRMVTHERTINQCLLNEVDKLQITVVSLKKDIDEWKAKAKELEISKTDITNSHNVIKRELEKSQKEAAKTREEKLALMQDILQLK